MFETGLHSFIPPSSLYLAVRVPLGVLRHSVVIRQLHDRVAVLWPVTHHGDRILQHTKQENNKTTNKQNNDRVWRYG